MRPQESSVISDKSSVDLVAPVTKRDHVRGALEAPVVLVEYGDYECLHCGWVYWVIKRLREELGDELAFVFRNFPVPELHPRAESPSAQSCWPLVDASPSSRP